MEKTGMKPEETKNREIVVSRDFEVPRERVFDAFSQPEAIGRWWGPDGFTTTTHGMEFRPGGSWIFTMHGPDGTEYPNRIVYTGIVRPERITYDHFGHEDGDGDPPHFQSTLTFAESEGGTTLTLRMLFPSAEARGQAAEFGAVEGGEQTLNRLAGYLSNPEP